MGYLRSNFWHRNGPIVIWVIAVVIILSGAFWMAVLDDNGREECIKTGHLYIEHHCYDNLKDVR
jgi:flagellar basal body rod protein FlgF